VPPNFLFLQVESNPDFENYLRLLSVFSTCWTCGNSKNYGRNDKLLSCRDLPFSPAQCTKISPLYQEKRIHAFIFLCDTLLRFTMHVFEKETVRIKRKNLNVFHSFIFLLDHSFPV